MLFLRVRITCQLRTLAVCSHPFSRVCLWTIVSEKLIWKRLKSFLTEKTRISPQRLNSALPKQIPLTYLQPNAKSSYLKSETQVGLLYQLLKTKEAIPARLTLKRRLSLTSLWSASVKPEYCWWMTVPSSCIRSRRCFKTSLNFTLTQRWTGWSPTTAWSRIWRRGAARWTTITCWWILGCRWWMASSQPKRSCPSTTTWRTQRG